MANKDENIVINLILFFAAAVLSIIVYGYLFWTVTPVPKQTQKSVANLRESRLFVAGVDDDRLNSFERRPGYEYYLAVFDWSNESVREKGMHVALKLNDNSIYVYDFAPRNANLLNFGDHLIDVDGKQYTNLADFETHITDAYKKERFCTCVVERPVSDEAVRGVTLTMLSDESSFSSIVSFTKTEDRKKRNSIPDH